MAPILQKYIEVRRGEQTVKICLGHRNRKLPSPINMPRLHVLPQEKKTGWGLILGGFVFF